MYRAKLFDWHEGVFVTISDASFAGETLIENGKELPRRSQRGRVSAIVHPSIWDEKTKSAAMYVIGWKSSMIKRVCRSTMAAETMALTSGVGDDAKMCTVIDELRGPSAKPMKRLWLTDCASLHSYLSNPVTAGCEDKRLEIDLQDLRQSLWEDQKGDPIDFLKDNETHAIRWIDTSTMLADPLTKHMKADRMMNAIDAGVLDLNATLEAEMQKYMKKKQRSKTGEESCVEEPDEGLDSQAKRLRTEQMPSHDSEEHNRIGLEDGVDR